MVKMMQTRYGKLWHRVANIGPMTGEPWRTLCPDRIFYRTACGVKDYDSVVSPRIVEIEVPIDLTCPRCCPRD